MKSNYLPNIYFKNTDPDTDEDDGGKGGGSEGGEAENPELDEKT